MDTVITRDVSIPRLGFGTFRMPAGSRAIGLCNFNLPTR